MIINGQPLRKERKGESMKHLEVRAYERQEIAEIMGLKVSSHNFIRDVRDRLEKWGYTCEAPRGGAVIITSKPETAQARLAEIMIRLFRLDIQIEVYDFACYLHFMLNEPAAQAMPWVERHTLIQEMYGLDISEITLRRWTKHLLDGDIMHKSEGRQDSEWWMTYTDSMGKHQEPVEEDALPQMHQYWKRHTELLNEWRIKCKGNESAAWSATRKQMWQEYQCCYYRCKCLTINGIGNEEINTILDLVDEILELNWESSNADQV